VLLAQSAVTQWTASTLSGMRGLGRPWAEVGGTNLYAPWAWVSWVSYVPDHQVSELRSLVFLSVAVPLLVAALVVRAKRVSTQHGSARWANKRDLVRAGLFEAVERGGVYVGAWRDGLGRVRYLRHDGPEHVLAFAPTRSGKGVGLVIPTLLSWRESALVLDIKGENWERTAGWRVQRAGQRVIRFDPTDPESARYNPLAEIRLETAHETADAQNIATMLVDPQGKGVERDHWAQTSWSLLVGAILHVCYRERRRGGVGTLAEVAEELTSSEAGDLTELTERWLGFHHAVPEEGWEEDRGPTPTHPVVAATAREMQQRTAKEASSVLSSALACLTLYRDPVIAEATSGSDFRVKDLIDPGRPTTVYLVIPPRDLTRVRPLLRLMLDQIVRGLTVEGPHEAPPLHDLALRRCLRRLKSRSEVPDEPKRRRVLLMLDEFAALGKMESLEHSLAHCAAYGVKAYLVVQDLAQLFAAYGRDESIVANCHIRVAFAPNNVQTAELLSKMTGTTTVVEKTGAGRRRHKTAHGRALLTADECMRLRLPQRDAATGRTRPGDCLIFVAGQPPVYGQQILYFTDAVLAARAELRAPSKRDEGPRRSLSAEEENIAKELLRSG
jgi:type IV secretion system protein VirD4